MRTAIVPAVLLFASARLPGDTSGLTDHDLHPVPGIPRPALRTPLTDPVFGTTVTRVTDPSFCPGAIGLRHEYARFPVVSADNKKVVVLVLGGDDRGQVQVREIATGKLLQVVPVDEDNEASWHMTDPNLLLYRYGNQVRRLNVSTGQTDTLITFSGYSSVSTKGEGRSSDDWHYYAGWGTRGDGGKELVVGDLTTGQIIGRKTLPSTPDWVTMSPKGNYVIVQYVSDDGTCAYQRSDLSYVRRIIDDYPHSDIAVDANGDECIAYYAVSGGEPDNFGGRAGVACTRIRDGTKTFLLENHYWYTIHVSGIGSRRHPGWVLVSTYVSPGTTQQPFMREVFWVKMDGSGEVRRIAHHHSDQDSGGSGKDYWAEPHATSSWDGSMVIFSSVWGSPFSRYDTYAVTGTWFGGTPPPDTVPPAAPQNLHVK